MSVQILTIMKSHSSNIILSGLIAVTASLVLTASGVAQQNALSAFPMHVDGTFSNGVGIGEWSDVTPAAFFSSGPGIPAIPLPSLVGANSLLFAALGTSGAQGEAPSLHLLYDFLPRTNRFVLPGEVVASITFPVTLPGRPTGDKQNVSVLFQGAVPRAGVAGAIGSFFDVFVDLDLDGSGDIPASQLGLVGVAGFGPSPLSPIDHLIVELGVALRIQPNFGTPGGPLPGNGINPATGLYDPAPAFWGAAGGGNGGGALAGGGAGGSLQPASAASFTINPNGSVSVTPVPEPSSVALLLAGFGLFGARRRKQAAA